MDYKKKINSLMKDKASIEAQVNAMQQGLNNLNRDYLILMGRIQAWEEMKALENGKKE